MIRHLSNKHLTSYNPSIIPSMERFSSFEICFLIVTAIFSTSSSADVSHLKSKKKTVAITDKKKKQSYNLYPQFDPSISFNASTLIITAASCTFNLVKMLTYKWHIGNVIYMSAYALYTDTYKCIIH